MESDREEKLMECRRVLQECLRPELASLRPPANLPVPPNSLIARWRMSDKLFEGRYSGTSTPQSPHTPVTNLEKRLRSVQSISIKDKHKEAAHRRRFPPIRELNFDEDDSGKSDKSEDFVASPLFSAQNSVNLGESIAFEDECEVSRYYLDFQELAVIASGDFGEVYRCQHRLDKQHYAVKRLKLSVAAANAREQALQEAFTLAASSFYYDSPHILKYRNMWIEREHLYIAMELCDCSLRTYVEREGSLALEQAVKIIRDVCKGLRELHAMNTVHMDIKPENILYSFSHIFKLGDLGLSRMISTLNDGAEVPEGDSRYLAPELLDIVPDRQESIPDLTKSDIFSLGATLYELITGTDLPSHGQKWHDLRNGTLDFKPSCDSQLVQAITRMMHPSPELRPSAKELLESVFLSPSRLDLKRLRNLVHVLDTKKSEFPVKRRKFSM